MSLRPSLKVRCLDYLIDGTMHWQCPPGLVLMYTERHDWIRILLLFIAMTAIESSS